MIPVLFERDEVDFQSNGIGQLPNVIDSYAYEIGNAEYELNLVYPTVNDIDGYPNSIWKELKVTERQILYKPSHSRKPHAFRIYNYEIDSVAQTITVYGRSRAYDLGNNVVKTVNINNQTPQAAMNTMKANLVEPTDFDFYSDMSTTSSTKWERQSGLSTIMGGEGSLIQYWGGEVLRENTRISLYNRVGKDNVTTLRLGKNIEQLNYDLRTDNMVTAIIPFYRYTPEGENKEEIVVTGNTVKSSKFNNYRLPYYQFVEYNEQDDNVTNLTTLNNAASKWFSEHPKVDEPTLTINVDMVDVAESTEYAELLKSLEQVNVFDTVSVYIGEYDIDVVVKVVSLKYDGFNERNLEVELGSASSGLFETFVNPQFDSISKQLDDVRKIGVDAQISADGKNTNYQGSVDPNEAGLVGDDGDIYFRTVGTEKQMWQYQVNQWNLILDTSRIDVVEKEVSSIIAQADADREAAEQNFEQAVVDAQTYTNTKAQEFDNKLVVVNQELANITQVANTAVTQANKAIEDANFAKVDAASAIDSAASALTKVDNLSTDVTNVRTDLNGNITALNQLKTDVDGYQITLTDHTGKISTIQNNVNGLQTTVADKADKTQVTQLSNQWTQTTNLVNGHTSQISSLGAQINLRVTAGQVTEAILADKTILDTRSTNQSPAWYNSNYPRRSIVEFKDRAVMEVPGSSRFVQVTTESPWIGSSGGEIVQTAKSSDGTFQRSSIGGLASWGSWEKIIEAGELISQINIQSGNILIQTGKLYLDTTSTHMTTAYVNDLKAKSLEAVYADIATLKTKVLTADVITSTMLKSDTALIDKIFATDANVNRLTAKTAFINSVKAIEISADKITTGTLFGNNVTASGINVSTIVGNISNFIQSNWNGLSSTVSITAAGMRGYSSTWGESLYQGGRLDFTITDPNDRSNYSVGLDPYKIQFSNSGWGKTNIRGQSEGLLIRPELTNTGAGLNSSIHLSGNITYLQFNDLGNNGVRGRIEVSANSTRFMSGNIVHFTEYNSPGVYQRTQALAYYTYDSVNTYNNMAIIGNRIQFVNENSNSNIYITPAINGKLVVGKSSSAVWYNVECLTVTQKSTRRIKDNIIPLANIGLNTVNALTVVEYDLKQNLARGIFEKQIGFIFEDSPSIANKEGESIDLGRVGAINTKAIQELSVFKDDHELRLKALEQENKELKAKIQQLESVA